MTQNKITLSEHLSQCTARILVNGGALSGTGFFVAPGLLLTCSHVITSAGATKATVEARWSGQNYAATIVRQTDPNYPDLALLQLTNPPADHPCVYIYPVVTAGDMLSTYGYPDLYPQGDPATFVCEGISGENALIKFKSGEVRHGFSGAPLLNQRTGAVCGVVKVTRGTDTSLGGRAIPGDRVSQEFSDLENLQKQFHSQKNAQWATYLTLEQRHLNGLDKLSPLLEDGPIEIFFSYHDNDQDRKILHRLEQQMAVLRRNGVIHAWHTDQITLSQSVEEETLKHLYSARVICLLVSPTYLSDDSLYDVHVKIAMERREKEGTMVIPILARPTTDLLDTSFGKLQATPSNRKPISQWADQDDASMTVVKEIKAALFPPDKNKKS